MTYTYQSDYKCYQQLVDQVATRAIQVGIVTALQETLYCGATVMTVNETIDVASVPRKEYERDCEAVYYSYVKTGKGMEQSRIEAATRLLEVGNRKGELTEQDRATIYKHMIDKDSLNEEEREALRLIHKRVFPMI